MDKMKKVKKKRKMAKKFTLPHGDLNPGFFEQNFPAQDLNFEGDQISRAHGFQKISTLSLVVVTNTKSSVPYKNRAI